MKNFKSGLRASFAAILYSNRFKYGLSVSALIFQLILPPSISPFFAMVVYASSSDTDQSEIPTAPVHDVLQYVVTTWDGSTSEKFISMASTLLTDDEKSTLRQLMPPDQLKKKYSLGLKGETILIHEGSKVYSFKVLDSKTFQYEVDGNRIELNPFEPLATVLNSIERALGKKKADLLHPVKSWIGDLLIPEADAVAPLAAIAGIVYGVGALIHLGYCTVKNPFHIRHDHLEDYYFSSVGCIGWAAAWPLVDLGLLIYHAAKDSTHSKRTSLKPDQFKMAFKCPSENAGKFEVTVSDVRVSETSENKSFIVSSNGVTSNKISSSGQKAIGLLSQVCNDPKKAQMLRSALAKVNKKSNDGPGRLDENGKDTSAPAI